MNRREFVRTAIATTTLLAVGVTGVFEIAAKVAADQSNAQQQALQLPPISTDTGQSATATGSPGASSSSASSQAATASSQSASASSQAPSDSSQAPATSVQPSSSSSSNTSSSTSQSSATTSQPSSSSSSSSSQSSSASAPAGYVLVAQLSSLSGKSSAYFNHPSHGSSIFVSLSGQWRAFSGVCTHRPCTVNFQSSELYCPCHGATFSATNGAVTRGPAQSKLGEYGVILQGGGVYVSNAIIN